MQRTARRSTPELNVPMLPISLLLGVVAWIICLVLYDALVDIWARPFVIATCFGVLALIVIAGVYITSLAFGTLEENILNGSDSNSIPLFLVGIVVAVFALGALFQWIYGLSFDAERNEPTSYVFIIDDSGSMESNDPTGLRYKAIQEVLADVDSSFPYMVYGFADETTILREMAPASSGVFSAEGQYNGGTYIKATLQKVIDDYRKGVWTGGDYPKIIFLTDGYASDLGLFSSVNGVLKEYSRTGISISTVGLGDVDDRLLQKIATKTGGVFIDIADASLLSDAMKSAAKESTSDDLLTMRYSQNAELLYGFLRILFISLLGIAIGFGTSIAYGQMDSSSLILLSSAIKAVWGAMMLEILTSCFGLSDRVLWFVLWILISLTICTKQVSYTRRPARPSFRGGRSSRRLR